MFSGGIERDQWQQMGQPVRSQSLNNHFLKKNCFHIIFQIILQCLTNFMKLSNDLGSISYEDGWKSKNKKLINKTK